MSIRVFLQLTTEGVGIFGQVKEYTVVDARPTNCHQTRYDIILHPITGMSFRFVHSIPFHSTFRQIEVTNKETKRINSGTLSFSFPGKIRDLVSNNKILQKCLWFFPNTCFLHHQYI